MCQRLNSEITDVLRGARTEEDIGIIDNDILLFLFPIVAVIVAIYIVEVDRSM